MSEAGGPFVSIHAPQRARGVAPAPGPAQRGFGRQASWAPGDSAPTAWGSAASGPPRPRSNNSLLIVVAVVLLGMGLVVLSAGLSNSAASDPAGTPRPVPISTIAPGPTQRPTPEPTPQPQPSQTSSASEASYQNDDYRANPPPTNPPPVPNPASQAQARQLLVSNALYAQTAPRPIRCTLTAINPSTATNAQLQRHFSQLTGCLMKEWDGVLAAAGYLAVRPTVTIYTQPIQTQCGRMDTHNTYYCSADQRIYYAPDFMALMPPRAAASQLSILLLIAHEFGHAIQARTGMLSAQAWLSSELPKSQALAYSRRLELQADCLAGRFAGSLAEYLQLSGSDRDLLAEAWNAIGDDVLWNDPDRVGDHGKGANRVTWLFTGINNQPVQLSACNTWVAPDQKVR